MDDFVIKTALDIETANEDLAVKVDAYLRKAGWKYTSTTPGFYWMWEREIGGKVYLVERDTAVRIQRSIEAQGMPSSIKA